MYFGISNKGNLKVETLRKLKIVNIPDISTYLVYLFLNNDLLLYRGTSKNSYAQILSYLKEILMFKRHREKFLILLGLKSLIMIPYL